MAYIGKSPQQGNYVVLDAITASSTNTYNLLNGGVAFTPESANHMIVSLNGVIQAPNTAFSVSGSTITFLPSSGTLSSSDSIDFIMVLGNVLDIGTPSDSTVTNAKTNFVSSSSSAGLSIKGDGTISGTGGVLQLNCSNNSHGIKLESPAHSAGQSYTLKFPTGNVTAGTALTVDSITGSGATAVGQLAFGSAGGVLQVKHMNYDTEQNTTSSSYVATNITLNITPTLSSSKILAIFSVPLYGAGGGVATATLYRDSTDLAVNTTNNNYGFGYVNGSKPDNISGSVLDSPSSTSQLTYAIYHKKISASHSYSCINTCTASLTLIEIASGVL
tara:strand:+ start:191 stop:1183 length:993 start_codon:yes stop_codon:yes gene_type:complete